LAQRTLTMWVIFAGPQQFRGSGRQYIASDGSVTHSKNEAQKFSTAEGARDFAGEQGITIDGATRHVGQEIFTQAELTWRPLGS
jgi:hypothetical protein